MNKSDFRFGSHLSCARGFAANAGWMRELGINAVQIMLTNGRVPWPKKHTDEEIAEFWRVAPAGTVVAIHMPYIVNLCSPTSDPKSVKVRNYTIKSAVRHIQEAKRIRAKFVVCHAGSYKEGTETEGLWRCFYAVQDILEQTKDCEGVQFLIETDAGGGTRIGTLESLRFIVNQFPIDKVGICLDSEHSFANGVDFNVPGLIDALAEGYGKFVKLIHLNAPDEGVTLGSHRDRHDSQIWGCKIISMDSFENLVKSMNVPVIIERHNSKTSYKDIVWLRELHASLSD